MKDISASHTRLYAVLGGFALYVYPFVGAALCLAAHVFAPLDVFFAYITLSLGLLLTLCLRELYPMLVPSLFYFFSANREHSPGPPVFSDHYHQPHIAILTLLYIVICVMTFILFRVAARRREKARLSKNYLSMLPFFIALIVGGVGNERAGWADIGYTAILALSFSILYLAFRPYMNGKRDALFLMRLLVALGLAVVGMLVFTHCDFYIANGQPVTETEFSVGWGVTTSVGLTLVMLIPSAFYLAAVHPRRVYYIGIGTLFLLSAPLSFSRGAMLFGGMVYLLSVFLYLYIRGFLKAIRVLSLALACGVVLVAVLSFFLPDLRALMAAAFNDNGRYSLFSIAVTRFIENPLFGSGFYDSYSNEWVFDVLPHFYHNTYLQILASAGIFGILAYAYHRTVTVKMLLAKRTPEVFFGMLGIFAIMLVSFLDVLFFIFYPGLIYSLYMLLFDSDNDGKSAN